jgi:hypothetical protein
MANNDKTFEIGLVMAGAVSAGAYTAGVVDFMVEALEEWQKAKDAGEKVPDHDLKIRVIAGASAGGMTAAILAGTLREDFRAKLRQAWVERVSLTKLLKTDDLKGGKAKSLLNSSMIPEIANEMFQPGADLGKRPYLADDIDIILTLANLRGVPYNVAFNPDSKIDYEMLNHRDVFHIKLKDQDELTYIDGTGEHKTVKEQLKHAAIGTGAFPGGLAAIKLKKRFKEYDDQKWTVPEYDPTSGGYAMVDRTIPPTWPKPIGDKDDLFPFVSVDGGVFNNEPFDLARKALAQGKRNPREAHKARAAMLMIDPFPNQPGYELDKEVEEPTMLSSLGSLISAMLAQGRFKAEDVHLAAREDIYSRFLIIPKKTGSPFNIACGAIDGFSGFIDESFRIHDFELGRRNAQRFFQKHFALEYNPDLKDSYTLFSSWLDDKEMMAKYAYEEDGKTYIPLIPLMGSAAAPIAKPAFTPLDKSTLDGRYRELIQKRTKAVLRNYADGYFKKWLKFALKGLVWWRGNKLGDKVYELMIKMLEKDGLVR